MLFLCCEWLCASSDLLLDWMTYGILNTCASCLHSWQAYVSPFWICFAQIRNIQHRGDWQTRSSGLDWIGFTSGYRVSTALRIYNLKNFFTFFKNIWCKDFYFSYDFVESLKQFFWTPTSWRLSISNKHLFMDGHLCLRGKGGAFSAFEHG